MVYSIGYLETVPTAAAWVTSNNLTFPVLADLDGSVSESYSGFFGGPATVPWTAIVGVDRILYYSENAYSSSGDSLNMSDILAIFDSLFVPEISADPGSLDFGQVLVGSSEDLEIVLDNAGTGLLEVTNVTSSSPVFGVVPTQGQVYAVDDSLVLTVTFSPAGEVIYDETLTITSSAGVLEVPLTGEGVPVGVKPSGVNLPSGFEVSTYPNPFNAELTIQVGLQMPQDVAVAIYNVQGARQAALWRGWLQDGTHKFCWAAKDAPSGLYFLNVSGRGGDYVDKVVLVR